MVGQYPHVLELLVAAEGIPDGRGGFTSTERIWKSIGQCRLQPNGTGRVVSTADGASVVFGAVVHLPLSVLEPLAVRDVVRVKDAAGLVIAKGEVLRFSRDMMHCRVWL
jgi:hypothetical protein